MNGWSWEPSVLVGALALSGGYLLCVGPWRRRFPDACPVARARIAAFLGGIGAIVLALATPLDTLSDQYLLSAHMVQHMLLTLVMPPLLLVGTPGWLLRPALRSWLVEALARGWTRPVAAFAVYNLVLAFSHFPPIYNGALLDHRLHVLMHLLYMVSAVATWWPICGSLPEYPRLSYPLQWLYLFAQTMPGALIGSMITLANGVLYPVYADAPRLTGLSPLADQQLAGLIMWLGVSTYLFAIMSVVFFRWASQDRARGVVPSTR